MNLDFSKRDNLIETYGGYFDPKELMGLCYWLLDLGFSHGTVRELESKFREPHRFYHGSFHIAYLWNLFVAKAHEFNEDQKLVLGLAIAFHDAVYEVVPSVQRNSMTISNEEASIDYFCECVKRDTPKLKLNDHVINAVCECIIKSDPKHYNDLCPGTMAYKFVTEFDLNHLVDPDFNLDLANRLMFREFQRFSFNEYVEGTERVLSSIPFSHVREGVTRAINWLKAPAPKFSFGVYAGSFDPFHVGHASILRQAEHLFDKVIILVGSNPAKNNETSEKRAKKVHEILPYHEVRPWTGLTTDYLAKLECESNANVTLIRGLRTDTDFAAEEQNQRWMEDLKPDLKIVYIPCEARYRHVSSSGLRYLDLFAEGNNRNEDIMNKKYKVNTEEHYRLTKEIVQRTVSSKI